MTRSISTPSYAIQSMCVGLLGVASLTEVGCVSRHAYERLKAETQELNRTLETVQEDVKGLDQQIVELQATNRYEDEAAAKARAASQQEEAQLSAMREQTGHKLASLQTQIAQMVGQSRQLAQQLAGMRRESLSLQAMSVQYKQELDEAQTPPKVIVANTRPTTTNQGPTAQSSVSPPSESTPAQISPSPQPAPPIQIAQAEPTPVNPVPTKQAPPPRPAKVIPPPVDDSWIGMITSWLAAIWKWLLS